jgi:hypothetical protein
MLWHRRFFLIIYKTVLEEKIMTISVHQYLICTKLLFFSEFFFEKSSAIIFIFKLKIMFWVSRHLAIKKRLHTHILEREKSLIILTCKKNMFSAFFKHGPKHACLTYTILGLNDKNQFDRFSIGSVFETDFLYYYI